MDLERLYLPRSLASLGLWRIRNWTFKAYGIHHDPRAARMFTAQRLEWARTHAAGQLELAEMLGDHEAVGYIILHQAHDELWHLQHWWTGDSMIAGITSHLANDQFVRSSEPFVATVWDMHVMTHERQAWIDTMLGPNRDQKAYVASFVPDGLY
jgi:hypothetical protein